MREFLEFSAEYGLWVGVGLAVFMLVTLPLENLLLTSIFSLLGMAFSTAWFHQAKKHANNFHTLGLLGVASALIVVFGFILSAIVFYVARN